MHHQADLTRAAVELQRSMLRKVLPLGADSARVAANEDLQVRSALEQLLTKTHTFHKLSEMCQGADRR